jgi:PAS domain-containing protein|tara:strand:+ start:547 stop:729 length:183 start_codon:yes stop_codon:yes gene_type:complete
LKKERHRLIPLAFCAAEILFEVDESWKIIYADGASQDLTSYEPQEAIGRNFLDLLDFLGG